MKLNDDSNESGNDDADDQNDTATREARAAQVFYTVIALCLSVSVSVCLSQVSILLKRLNGLSWFLAWRLPSTYPTLCFKEIQVTPK